MFTDKMDQSHEDVNDLLDILNDYRRTASQVISDVYAKSNKKILQSLKDLNIKLQIHEINCNLPDNSFQILNLRQLHQFDEEVCAKIYKQIQLLSILIKKKDSMISKVIDEI